MRATVIALLGGLALAAPANAAVPAGFADERVVVVPVPTALAWTPDGRMLVTSQRGALRIVQNDALLPAAALDLTARVCSDGERGLLGVAVDPEFASNGFVYLYYTASTSGTCVNRVSRFVLGVSSTIDAGSERVLVENASPRPNHEGGDVQFGKDGYLYVTIGDGAQGGAAARDRSTLFGKILRITRDGGVPPDNPFGTVVYAYGLRNPWRIALDPNAATTRFFVNDVGETRWEEIDLLQAGADYGWNLREGRCSVGSTTNCGPSPAGMTDPLFVYDHAGNCNSITGGAFVPNGLWPGFDGAYLFADVVCGRIWRLDQNAGTYVSAEFATGLGTQSVVSLAFGPWRTSRALYYTSYGSGGEVRRIVSTAAAPTPPPPPPPPAPPPPPVSVPPPVKRCVVPSVRGLTLRTARARIERARCRLGSVTRARSRTVAAGRVLRQSPAAGAVRPAGTRVALVLARRA